MMDDTNRRLMRELRSRLGNLQMELQCCTPLFMEKGTARQREYLAMLNQNLYAMLRTVSHLELTGGDSFSFRPVTLDLAGFCRKLGRELDGLAELAEVRFTCETDEASLLAEADEELLEQGLLNLISNAMEAARRGGGHVRLLLRRSGGSAVFTVEDDGPGFPEKTPDPESLKPHPGGVGLGLKVAQEAAARHGGTLLRLNRPRGVQISLILPVHRPGETILRSSCMGYESSGGFSPLLVELSTVLPHSAFLPDNLD